MPKPRQILKLSQVNTSNKKIIVTVTYIPSKAKQGRAPYAVRIRGHIAEYRMTEQEAVGRARQITELFMQGGSKYTSGTMRAAVDLFNQKIKQEYEDGCIVWGHYKDQRARAIAFVDIKQKIRKEKFQGYPTRHWECRKEGLYEKDIHGKYIYQYTPRSVNGSFVGDLKVADITKSDCKNLLKEFSHLSQDTVNAYKLTLIAVLDVAQDEKWLLENPARNIRNKRKKYGLTEKEIEDAPLAPFPPHKIAAVIKAAENAEQTYGNILWCDSLALLFMCRTGVRFGELAALKWKSLEFHNKRVIVRTALRKDEFGYVVGAPKDTSKRSTEEKRNHKVRIIPIGSSLIARLQEWKLRSPCSDAEDRVFIKPNLEMHTTSWHLRESVLRKSCRAVNFEPKPGKQMKLHHLRHVFASTSFDFYGENYSKVAELLGHAKIDTTRNIYSHWFSDVERDMEDADGMEESWERQSQQLG